MRDKGQYGAGAGAVLCASDGKRIAAVSNTGHSRRSSDKELQVFAVKRQKEIEGRKAAK